MDFEEMYTTYFRDVYLYIRRLSGDEDLAEEITSECFFKALQASDTFRGECELRVWLCQIAKNCYYHHIKRHKKLENLENFDENTPDLSENTEENLIGKDDARRIRAHLHEIGEPYKEVFMWRVFAELSFKQIGQIFGKSENWACVTYHRAKHMIKERMEETK